jgi:hypothetical protein
MSSMSSMSSMSNGKIIEVKLTHRTEKGTLVRSPATIEYVKGKIKFLKSPFALKNEIKAMKGSRFLGYDDVNPEKVWQIDDCPRNRFQLGFLMGEDVYAWYDRDLVRHEYERPLMPHQNDMADGGLTYHYQIWAAEMGTGKTLAAQEVIERSGVTRCWWVGPKTSLPNMKREFKKWGFPFERIDVDFITYDELVKRVDAGIDDVPRLLIVDEASRCKTASSQRSKAVQAVADLIREQYGMEGYAIEMSGTPAPKSPKDWWSLCEIAWPGFLREGSDKALESRLAFTKLTKYDSGAFNQRIGWRDDENKCNHCGRLRDEGPHELDGIVDPADYHKYEKSVNEVAYMYERLQGLVIIKHLKDCIQLPEKQYRKVICKPTSSVLRVAKAISASAPNAMTAMERLRELSDGFQYREQKDGTIACTHCPDHKGLVDEWFLPGDEERVFAAVDMLDPAFVAKLTKRLGKCPRCLGEGEIDKLIRISREVPCPKEAALRECLEEAEENGRIVTFAGFTGSVDRVAKISRKEQWSVVRCDGRGWEVTLPNGDVLTQDGGAALDYWADRSNPRVAFVSHPASGGMSLTLVESRMEVYWSNTFKPEDRSQSEARCHRKGMDENRGVTIVDLIHLPSDERCLDLIRENRRIELLTMGEVMGDINWESGVTA